MDREIAFKKIMVMFKRGDITPQQLGHLMSQYYERYVIVDKVSNPLNELVGIFDGKLGLEET